MWSSLFIATVHVLAVVVAAPQTAPHDFVPATIAEGSDSSITDARQVVVRTENEWNTLWAAHRSEATPKVDFSRLIVVGVFLGSRPTAGFRVEITGATVQGDQAVVRFVEHRPAADAIFAQLVTAPFQLVTLPSTVRTVRFQQR